MLFTKSIRFIAVFLVALDYTTAVTTAAITATKTVTTTISAPKNSTSSALKALAVKQGNAGWSCTDWHINGTSYVSATCYLDAVKKKTGCINLGKCLSYSAGCLKCAKKYVFLIYALLVK